MVPKHLVEFLDQVATTPHGRNGSLKVHLFRTYEILCTEKAEEAVCLAGLFHSIYGTTHYKVKSVSNREVIRSLIGERAERLVWLFCQWDRRQTIPSASAQEMADLVILESANRRTQ